MLKRGYVYIYANLIRHKLLKHVCLCPWRQHNDVFLDHSDITKIINRQTPNNAEEPYVESESSDQGAHMEALFGLGRPQRRMQSWLRMESINFK